MLQLVLEKVQELVQVKVLIGIYNNQWQRREVYIPAVPVIINCPSLYYSSHDQHFIIKTLLMPTFSIKNTCNSGLLNKIHQQHTFHQPVHSWQILTYENNQLLLLNFVLVPTIIQSLWCNYSQYYDIVWPCMTYTMQIVWHGQKHILNERSTKIVSNNLKHNF